MPVRECACGRRFSNGACTPRRAPVDGFTLSDVPVVVSSPAGPLAATFQADLRYDAGEPGRWTVTLWATSVAPTFAWPPPGEPLTVTFPSGGHLTHRFHAYRADPRERSPFRVLGDWFDPGAA
jgi:hypothetical protein